MNASPVAMKESEMPHVYGGLFFSKTMPFVINTSSSYCVFMRRPRKWYHVREWLQVFKYVANLPYDDVSV